ncbi:ribosomal protein L13 domain-containing protein [Ephemerocybe angulata]|uniref:Ribosomal protein L13 domain-containing protein n=1 Tax=Ephemerocybe angulata TaxID=980116 RepID=A0A8H6HA32_9AGAR|nr:ribosomal protein L13 domain-containing protein [Tulosesus angulatus]
MAPPDLPPGRKVHSRRDTSTIKYKGPTATRKGHLLGRLASIIAKQVFSGQKIVVQLRYYNLLRERHIVNPKKSSPFHHRAPSKFLYRAIRGMVPHKSARGAATLERLRLFEGSPLPYNRKKRMPGRKHCTAKPLSHEVGWGYKTSSTVLRKSVGSRRRPSTSAGYIPARIVAHRLTNRAEGGVKRKEVQVQMIKGYREKIESELAKICTGILMSSTSTFPPPVSGSADKSLAYKAASNTAMTKLAPTHPIRLGLPLHFSVFYYEILNSPLPRPCLPPCHADL